jgi:hypothetical protein
MNKSFRTNFEQLMLDSERQRIAHQNKKNFIAFKRQPNLKNLLARAQVKEKNKYAPKG